MEAGGVRGNPESPGIVAAAVMGGVGVRKESEGHSLSPCGLDAARRLRVEQPCSREIPSRV